VHEENDIANKAVVLSG